MTVTLYRGDVLTELAKLPADSVHMICTSPPYWGLRDYGVDGQLGLEPTIDEYVAKMVEVGRALRRVLRPDGVMFWNHGDCYCHDRLSSKMGGDYAGDDGLYQRKADNIGGSVPHRTGNGLKSKDLVGQPWRWYKQTSSGRCPGPRSISLSSR